MKSYSQREKRGVKTKEKRGCEELEPKGAVVQLETVGDQKPSLLT